MMPSDERKMRDEIYIQLSTQFQKDIRKRIQTGLLHREPLFISRMKRVLNIQCETLSDQTVLEQVDAHIKGQKLEDLIHIRDAF